MNRSFKVVFNAVRNAFAVVSEAAPSHRKSCSLSVTSVAAAVTAALAASSVAAYSVTGPESTVSYGDGNYAAFRPDFSQGPVSQEYSDGLRLDLTVSSTGEETVNNVFGIGLNNMTASDDLTLTVGGEGLQINVSAPDSVAIRAIASNNGHALVVNGDTSITASRNVSADVTDIRTYGVVLSGNSSAIFNGDVSISTEVSGDDALMGHSIYSQALGINEAAVEFTGQTELTSTNELYTANPINAANGTVTFSGGDVSIAGLSQYGVNGIYAGEGSTIQFANDGDVAISAVILEDGIGRSNAIGYMASPSNRLNVAASVNSFAVSVYGAGFFDGNQLKANGTIGLEVQCEATAEINAGSFTVNVVAGQNYSGTVNGHDFEAAFDSDAAKALGSSYSATHGIVNAGSLTVSKDTDTSVSVSDGYWNAIGIKNDPYRMDHDNGGLYSSLGTNTSLDIGGNLTVVANGTANNTSSEYTTYTNPWGYSRFSDTVALISRGYDGTAPTGTDNGVKEPIYLDPFKITTTLGSAGKTVSLTASTEKPEGSEEKFSDSTYALLSDYSTVNIDGSSLVLNSSSNSGGSVYGLYAGNESTVIVDSENTAVTVASTAQSTSGTTRPYGIFAEEGSTVTFNGDVSIDVSGVGTSGAWGHGIDSRSGSTVSFNGNADISTFQELYTAQTLTARKGSAINFAGTGDVVIDAKSPYGSTAIVVNDSQAQYGDAAQNGGLSFNNAGTVTINAGYADSADGNYDSTGFLTTNAVAILPEKGTVEIGSNVTQANINVYGQGADFDGSSFADGTVGIFIQNKESSVTISSQALNINVLAEAPADAELSGTRLAENAYGIRAYDGNFSISSATTLNVVETRGDAYGIALMNNPASASSPVSGSISGTVSGALTITAQGNTAAYGVYLAEGASLTLADADITATASSEENAYAIAGAGTLTLTGNLTATGSLADFTGALNLDDGSSFTLDGGRAFGGSISIKGGYFTAADVSDVAKGIVLSSGSLQTSSAQIFANGLGEEGTAEDAGELLTGNNVTLSGGTLVLDDAYFNVSYVDTAKETLGSNVSLTMLGSLVGYAEDEPVDVSDLANSEAIYANVTGTTTDNDLVVGTTGSEENTTYHNGDLGLGDIELGEATKVTVTGNKALTVIGNGTDTISSSSQTETLTIAVGDETGAGTLNLGHDSAAKGGNLDGTVNVSENGALNVTGAAYDVTTINSSGNVTVNSGATLSSSAVNLKSGTMSVAGAADISKLSLSDGSTLYVGNTQTNGEMTVESLTLESGAWIIIDPPFTGDPSRDTIENASFASYSTVADFSGGMLVSQNSLVSIGAEKSDALQAYKAIAQVNGLAWSKEVMSAAFIGAPVTVSGQLVIDGSTNSDTSTYTRTGVSVLNGGMLIVDQSVQTSRTTPLITGKVSIDGSGSLGVYNASEGEFFLSSEEIAFADGASIYTDNPFLKSSVSGSKIVTGLDAQNGLSALASTGLQAMTRRADSVLAQTIADRTSVDQELKPGINLWVDVAGESYKTDNLDNGGEFKADMGYGTFGGDVAFGCFTVGGAFQYGSGSLRSSVSSIKNDIDNYAVSLYGTYKVTDAFKLAGELAYVWSENDISASQAALNQSVDTEMYSLGLRAMYKLTAGNFSFVPSIGVRVSQLSTDAMQVGSVKVEDQDQTLVQVPLALRINASTFDASGWTVAPSFKIAYVPTFGDKDISVLSHSQDVIDTSPVQADFGVRVGKDNMLFNVNMMLGGGKYGSSAVGGKVGFKYVF